MRALADIVDRMSPSKLELFERCGESFLQRYVLGRRSPPRAANALGNAVDATTNGVYFQKLQDQQTLPAGEVVDRFAAWWDVERARVVEWAPDEKPGEILDTGAAAMRAWRDQVAVRVQPTREPQVTVEIPVRSADPQLDAEAGIGSEFVANGVFDVVARVPVPAGGEVEAIIDHKASGKGWRADDVLRSAAAPIYVAGTRVPRFQFHVLRTDLVNPRTSVVSAEIPQTAIDHVLRRMAIARRAIARCYRTGDWIPNRNHFLCSRTWCGFWQSCESRHGGTVTP